MDSYALPAPAHERRAYNLGGTGSSKEGAGVALAIVELWCALALCHATRAVGGWHLLLAGGGCGRGRRTRTAGTAPAHLARPGGGRLRRRQMQGGGDPRGRGERKEVDGAGQARLSVALLAASEDLP